MKIEKFTNWLFLCQKFLCNKINVTLIPILPITTLNFNPIYLKQSFNVSVYLLAKSQQIKEKKFLTKLNAYKNPLSLNEIGTQTQSHTLGKFLYSFMFT